MAFHGSEKRKKKRRMCCCSAVTTCCSSARSPVAALLAQIASRCSCLPPVGSCCLRLPSLASRAAPRSEDGGWRVKKRRDGGGRRGRLSMSPRRHGSQPLGPSLEHIDPSEHEHVVAGFNGTRRCSSFFLLSSFSSIWISSHPWGREGGG